MGRRLIKLFLLLPVVVMLSSCSYSSDFVVVNKSGSPLEVQYKLKETRASTEGTYTLSERPAKKSSADLEDGDVRWQELGSGEFTFDEKVGLVTVNLQPGDALRIHDTINYSPESDADAGSFPITGLRLNGARGTVQYVGEQARLQFKELTGSIYTVTYY